MKGIQEGNMKYFYYFVIYVLFFFVSCSNQYEENLVGEYKALNYERIDTLIRQEIDTSTLKLYRKNKFSLCFTNKTVNGSWEAGDNGDFTWIRFNYKGKELTEGRVGDSIIIITTPTNFFNPGFKRMTFRRIQ